MSEQQDQQAPGPVAGFIKKNKIGIIVASALLIGGIIWTSGGSGDDEPTAVPAVSSTAQPGPGTASPSPAASASPSASKSPTSTPKPAEIPSGGPPGAAGGTGTQPLSDTDTPLVGNHQQAPPLQEWEPAAEAFSTAWADTSGGKTAWLKRLQPLITERLYDNLSYTSLEALYDDEFSTIVVDEEHASYKIFTAHYEENGPLLQGLIKVQADGSWLVDTTAPPEE